MREKCSQVDEKLREKCSQVDEKLREKCSVCGFYGFLEGI